MATEVLYINHASLLIRYGNEFLLTDPWFESPAFGSWLPIPSTSVHPSYLASLKNLSILISHGHDDHCDDRMLKLFDPSTPIITSDFESPGVVNRLKRIGFQNVEVVGGDGKQVGAFKICSSRNHDVSLDDALYTIDTPDALVVHCNDLWNDVNDTIAGFIAEHVRRVGPEKTLYASQTNSASGYPLSYRNWSAQEKEVLLRNKVHKMISVGMKNAARVGAKHFLGYAGFAGIFVKDRPEYLTQALFPSPEYIHAHLGDKIPDGLTVLDMMPGDTFHFPGVKKGFFNDTLDYQRVKEKCIEFYHQYDVVQACHTFKPALYASDAEFESSVVTFLNHFNNFVRDKVARSQFEKTALGKIFRIELADSDMKFALRFGEGLVDPDGTANKTLYTSRSDVLRVIRGEIIFEDLYTGYNADFRRDPADVYNRDIVVYLIMFSYFYRNRILGLGSDRPNRSGENPLTHRDESRVGATACAVS